MGKTDIKCELVRTEVAPPGEARHRGCVAFNTVCEDYRQNDHSVKKRHHEKCPSFNWLDKMNHYVMPSADGMDIADRKSIGLT